FCHITQNWRGRPPQSRTAVVELIAATKTKTGLKVECVLDERTYEKGIKVSDAEMYALDIAATRSILNGTIRCTHGPKSSSYFCLSPKGQVGPKQDAYVE